MPRRVVEWTKTPIGLMVMLSIIFVMWGATGWAWLDYRATRQQEQSRVERIEAERREWLAMEIYAPTALKVRIGATPQTTLVVESPDFEGPRVLADFPGQWVVRLRHVATDALLCTMPATGPRYAPYRTDSAQVLDMTWAQYTGDDGSCFARMEPGETYDLTTIREATRVIGGQAIRRFLEPVRSEPFVGPKS
jgi:hypothetical protein